MRLCQTRMISQLPQDLIEEIVYRVPVTSLRRLRSTCKGWYHQALFKDPRFIKKHFDKTARQYHALMLLSEAFHCDGILLCSLLMKTMIVVWNPFSGQTRWIQVTQLQDHYIGAYALGYNNKELCRSYKILRFRCQYGKLAASWGWGALNVTPEPEGNFISEIYEFSSNLWRNLDSVLPDQAYLKPSGGVSLNGNTYWMSCNKKGHYSLLSFDFSTEKFQRLCAPFHHEPCHIDTRVLSVVREERLSLLYQSRKTLEVEIWMTDEIETTFVSWSKFLRVDLLGLNHCFSDSMSFSIIDEEKKVVVCCDEAGNFDFTMVWIVKEGEEYRASPDISVDGGVQAWSIPHLSVPRLFGYVPKN
ncbi:putative F-box protein At3g17560 [Capsella rubella]|uniref:putative F-box protein At3g17560 n=1 Tax=Capsella rubella TaxID=81985 RepID=UPI000CD49E5F|nr:putative F-box protein At3g17560 [Capsella rubella]